jgi:3-hydroxybutyryl-CoA dehydrogenase
VKKATRKIVPADINIGVVGLGLMGCSIITSLLIAGHRVKAIGPMPVDIDTAPLRIREHLVLSENAGLLNGSVEDYLLRLTISEAYEALGDCSIVLECVKEKIDVKDKVYRQIAQATSPDTIIASNTSAIPIGILQPLVANPERFLGIHWAEPAYATRFLEITCGGQTAPDHADWVFKLAHQWGKEPTLLRKDIRGFITNRLMYALYREALYLMEKGGATLEDADKALKYDFGSWMTLMGIFRRMDFTGLKDYSEIFRALFPGLSNTDKVPVLMQRLLNMDARGVKNLKGLYTYTEEEAKEWNEAFALYNNDIYWLAGLYPSETASKMVQSASK